MVSCRSCNIYWTWRRKEGKGDFKVIISGDKPKRGDQFLWGKFSPLDTMVLVQKYKGLSISTIYNLETYDTNLAVACLR